MDIDVRKIKNHKKVQTSTKKFHILFEVVHRQRQTSTTPKVNEELFFLEIDLINSYFQILTQEIETILAIEPDIYDVNSLKKEKQRNVVMDLARSHVIETLNQYENIDITRILKIASLSDMES